MIKTLALTALFFSTSVLAQPHMVNINYINGWTFTLGEHTELGRGTNLGKVKFRIIEVHLTGNTVKVIGERVPGEVENHPLCGEMR